jgi:hypothetical protein
VHSHRNKKEKQEALLPKPSPLEQLQYILISVIVHMTLTLSPTPLTCTDVFWHQCQELLDLVNYQSRQELWVSSVRLPRITVLGGGVLSTARLFAGNTVSIHETNPFGCADALSGQWPGVPPAYSRAPPVL